MSFLKIRLCMLFQLVPNLSLCYLLWAPSWAREWQSHDSVSMFSMATSFTFYCVGLSHSSYVVVLTVSVICQPLGTGDQSSEFQASSMVSPITLLLPCCICPFRYVSETSRCLSNSYSHLVP
jgi:hypothetical protein